MIWSLVMLQAYNCLFPYEYQALHEDEYVKAMVARIDSHNSIIDANISSGKTGTLILPCTIHDIDGYTFEFRDGLGRPIDTKITMVNSGAGWVDVDFTGPIQNTEGIYSEIGKIVYVKYTHEPILFNKTVSGSPEMDGKMFSLNYYERLEFLYNSRLGCTFTTEEEVVSSFDSITGIMVTDQSTYTLEYPAAVEFDVDDTIPADTFIDKAVALEIVSPYVQVTIKKEYSYIKKIFTFDSNKIINILD